MSDRRGARRPDAGDTARARLDARVLAAYAADDRAELIGLYAAAAASAGSTDEAGFFLTQAYVFALEAGDGRARGLHATLVGMGRDQ